MTLAAGLALALTLRAYAKATEVASDDSAAPTLDDMKD